MKRMKWICRYGFLGLVFLLSLAWCIYCAVTVGQLNSRVNSLEYIDLAVQLSPEAVEILDRIDQFEGLLQTAIIVTVALALCLGGLVVYHVLSIKRKDKKTSEKKVAKFKKKSSKQMPHSLSGFCTNCGQFYKELPPFCVKCGERTDIK